ncbi:hypothetical protein D0T49_12970, partial [Paludibacter sp. 221]|uniref:hypothetical protein n=1 Tax=Paludibacter sp. 221 TaxID=2302939 RepID=UPI0013D1D93A
MRIGNEFMSMDHLKVCAGKYFGVDPEKVRAEYVVKEVGREGYKGLIFFLGGSFITWNTAGANSNYRMGYKFFYGRRLMYSYSSNTGAVYTEETPTISSRMGYNDYFVSDIVLSFESNVDGKMLFWGYE